MFQRCTHKTQTTGGRYNAFKDDTTGHMILNNKNYTEIAHRHVGRCYSTIKSDELCNNLQFQGILY